MPESGIRSFILLMVERHLSGDGLTANDFTMRGVNAKKKRPYRPLY